jgi:hypothetical protein
MQHKERRAANEKAIRIVLLTIVYIGQSLLTVLMVSVAYHQGVRVPARATGANPRPLRGAKRQTFRATHARDNPRSMLCETERALRRPWSAVCSW